MAHTVHTLANLSAAPRLPLIAKVFVYCAGVVVTWDARRRTRIDLSRLDDSLLDDLGMTRREAYREYRKYFWQT